MPQGQNGKESDLNRLFAKAFGHHQSGNLDQAEEMYKQILESLPDNINVLANLALLCNSRNRANEAVEYCNRALSVDPENGMLYLNLGTIYESLGKSKEAASAYHKALAIEPDNSKALNNLGKVLYEQGNTMEALICMEKAVRLKPDYVFALNNLGVIQNMLGKYDEAARSFEQASALNPFDTMPLYNLGGIHNTEGRTDEAVSCFKKVLELDPYHSASLHMIAALTGKTTESAPPQYIEQTYDKYAFIFDTHLVKKLEYGVPSFLIKFFQEVAENTIRFKNGIDLGCGTGLSGSQFRPLTENLTGIDLSSKMLEKAREKEIYDNLHKTDIIEFLSQCATRFDLFIATEVFIYIGNLQPVFESIKRCAAPGAFFLFSTEKLIDEESDYLLLPSGRYAHATAYLERCAAENGFTILEHRECNLRKEQKKWIPGEVYILSSSGTEAMP